jgi:hypothetical protein
VDPATGGWDNRIGYEKFFPNGVVVSALYNLRRGFTVSMFGVLIVVLELICLYESENIAAARCDLNFLVGQYWLPVVALFPLIGS